MADNMDAMEERNHQTLSDIKNLQKVEQDLYDSLEQEGQTLSAEQKTSIINKINEISQMRVNLYSNLQDMYSFLKTNVSNSRTTLAEQMMALDIVENELSEAKRRLQLLEDEKYNKLRLVEINTYYGEKYNANANVMKSIVFMCIPIIIISILANSNLLPQVISGALIFIILVFGIIYIIYQLIDISNRDNMNFQEYDWNFNAKDAPAQNESADATNPWEKPILPMCNPLSTVEDSISSTSTSTSTTTSTTTSSSSV